MAYARVKKIEDDKLTVEMNQPTDCEECDSLACSVAGRSQATIKKPAGLDVAEGDMVEVTPRSEIMWGAGAILFLLPLVFFAVATYLGHSFGTNFYLPFEPELNGIITGIIALLISFPVIRILGKKFIGEGETLAVKTTDFNSETD